MDVVDRTERINSLRYAKRNPKRIVVQVNGAHVPPRWRVDQPFLVYRGLEAIAAYATFAEAIDRARRMSAVDILRAAIEREQRHQETCESEAINCLYDSVELVRSYEWAIDRLNDDPPAVRGNYIWPRIAGLVETAKAANSRG